jgi:hypothetical protein
LKGLTKTRLKKAKKKYLKGSKTSGLVRKMNAYYKARLKFQGLNMVNGKV